MTSKTLFKYSLALIITLSVSLSPLAVAEEFEAVLGWSKRVELSTSVNGMVQKVFVQSGNVVAKGEALVQLDPRVFKADLKYAKAKFTHANEQSLEAKRELDRQLDMYDRSMLSEHDLQVAKNNFSAAQSSYLQAQADLTKAKLNLEYSAIRAPFNAIVINTTAVKGQVVVSETRPPVLVVVAEAKRMQARFFVTAAKANELVLKQGVTINVVGESYQGKIVSIAIEPDELKAGYYAVDVIFDSKEAVLRSGQKAIVNL